MHVLSAPNAGSGVKWEALNGGSFDDENNSETNYLFTTDEEISARLRISATTQNADKTCLAATAYMNIFVHRTPCIDFEMDLDLSTKILKLTPAVDSFPQYQWTIGDSTSFEKNATFDVSSFKDSLVRVRLETYNKGGDNCITDKIINLKNGGMGEIVNATMKVYPNPVTEGFFIDIQNELYMGDIVVYSMEGKVVQSTWVSKGYVSCKDLTSGVYSYQIIHRGTAYNGKFVKQ